MNEQHGGRKYHPVSGAALDDVEVQLDSNFGSLRSDMHAEFKAVQTEMNTEFNAVRAEMAEGFARFQNEPSRIPLKTAARVFTTMIGPIGVGCAPVAVVIAVF